MSHSLDCKLAATGKLDYTCEDCLDKKVGDLDDRAFRNLMGTNRKSFEDFCRVVHGQDLVVQQGGGQGPLFLPSGLYNFWYAIMDSRAVSVQVRKEELERRIASAGRV